MQDKTTNQFTRDMIEAFGIDQLAIRLTTLDGALIKQTDNWIDEAEFIRREKQQKARQYAQPNQRGTYGYKRN